MPLSLKIDVTFSKINARRACVGFQEERVRSVMRANVQDVSVMLTTGRNAAKNQVSMMNNYTPRNFWNRKKRS